MNDELIRASFHNKVLYRYQSRADVLVLNELGLFHGKSRADIAVVNGSLTGYEIKSDEDSLERLSEQVKIYSSIFDRAFLITGNKHRKTVVSKLPKWWGVIVCTQGKRGGIKFRTWRRAQLNNRIDPIAVARLLWKSEACHILENLGDPQSSLRQRRILLYKRLVKRLQLAELRGHVRERLKQRKNWRRPQRPSPYDGWYPPNAM